MNQPSPREHAVYEDEITLVDMAVALWEHKWVILGITGLCTVIGVAYALSMEVDYEYTSTIEIGTRLVGNRIEPIETPHNVAAKLENTYVPEAIRTYQQELLAENGLEHRLKVDVSVPRDTGLIILSSRGPEELARYYIPLQNRVLQHLVQDHGRETELERVRLENELEQARISMEELEDERVLRVERKQMENRIAEEKNRLAGLADQEELLRAELENIDVQEELVRRRLEELVAFVSQARERRTRAQQQVQSGTDSMALMLIDNELQRDIDRQVELEERLLVQIPENRADLRSQLEENQRQQAYQREIIAGLEGELEKLLLDQERALARHMPEVRELEANLANLRETHAVLPPRQSLQPAGVGRTMIVTLTILLGGFLGLFAAGIAVLIRSTRVRLQH